MIHLAALALLGALCLTACVLDLRFRRLPNWLCAVTAVTGIAHAVAISGGATAWYSSLLHGTVALIIGMVLFAFRWIGGGDAKFYAALACWLPFRQAPLLLTSVCLVGFLLLVAWFTVRRIQGKKISMGRNREEAAKLPFGIAIALGGLLAVAN